MSSKPIDKIKALLAAFGLGESSKKSGEEAELVKEYGEKDFLSDLELSSKAYLVIVAASAVLVAGAIVLAVLWNVFYGLLLAIIAVLLYIAATGRMLYARLGFSYDSIPGALRITGVYGKHRNQIFIPRRLLWLDVAEIGEKAFCHASSSKIRAVYLPSSLKTIGKDIFEGCEALSLICFEGSEEEWNAIEKETSFEGIEMLFGQTVNYPVKQKKVKKDKAAKKNNTKKEAEENCADGGEEK